VGVSAAADTGVKCCDAGWSVLRRQVSYGHKSNVRSADNTQRVSRSSHYVVCSLSDCAAAAAAAAAPCSSVSTPRLHSAHYICYLPFTDFFRSRQSQCRQPRNLHVLLHTRLFSKLKRNI